MRWVLLRGLIREQRHWLDFPSFFEAHVQGPGSAPTQVVLLDLPGFGTQNDAVVPETIAAFVDEMRVRLRAVVPSLGERHGEPCGLFAVSLGGMVALSWLAQHPEDFVGGVIVNSSLGDVSPLWHRMQPRNWPHIARAPFMAPRARERMLLGLTRHQGDLDKDADRYAAIATHTVPNKKNFVGQLRAALRVRSPPRLDVPALVLASVGDNLVSWRCSEAIAKRLALPLKLHEGTGKDAAGHDLPLDAPAWVCAQVNAWTATLPERA